ncbi:hypothetical protein JCM8097_006392 [Rhodosporidiobolus ruineniae]
MATPAPTPHSALSLDPTSPLRSPPTSSSSSSSARPQSLLIHNVRGAEGGVEAITARRRNSGSFKHMSSGNFVKNSPFAQRLGTVGQHAPALPTNPQPAPTPLRHQGLYGGESRIPMAVNGAGSARKNSGGSLRWASGEATGPVKENSNPSLVDLAGGDDDSLSRRSGSPFKPTRNALPPSSAASSALPPTSAHAPFKPSRPQFGSSRSAQPQHHQQQEEEDGPRRKSAGFALLKKNGLVSSSPFTSSSAAQQAPSPDLPQAPYEIGALSHESAPFGYQYAASPDLDSSATSAFSSASSGASQLGLGARPGTAASGTRSIGGSAVPPPNTPPHERRRSLDSASSGSPTKTSALSPVRRGMRGSRPLGAAEDDDGDETERDEPAPLARTLRRQPSNKTVTWAETEEVLEFEVEEERRRSMMSDVSSTASDDDRRYYGHGGGQYSSDEEDLDDPYAAHYHGGNGSYSFEEGGSVEVHDLADSDAEDSVVSTGSSAMDDMIGQIDSYIHEGESFSTADVFSPSQIPSFSDAPDLPSHRTTDGYSSPGVLASPRVPPPMSAFSVSTTSGADEGSVVSTSSYGDDNEDEEEEHLQQAREQILARQRASLNGQQQPSSPRPPLPSPPTATISQQLQPALPISASPANAGLGLVKSDSQYSLPDVPKTSPFLGFADDGGAESVVTLDDRGEPVPTTRPLQPRPQTPSRHEDVDGPNQSTPTSAISRSTLADSPILSGFSRLSDSTTPTSVASPTRPDLSPALSRKASLIGTDVSTASSSAMSWYGSSVNGSLRDRTVRLGRDRLDERMKAHQALFGSNGSLSGRSGSGSPIASFGAFPAVPSSSAAGTAGAVSSAAMDAAALSAPARSHGQAIEARPAPKARSATLSSSMLPTFAASAHRSELANLAVGDPLTPLVAEEMQSPLERLQRGAQGHPSVSSRTQGGEGEGEGSEVGMWRSGDSLLGVNEVAEGRARAMGPVREADEESSDEDDDGAPVMTRSGSAGSALEERERTIIAKRREKNGLAPPSAAGKGRRRSRSTGDADVAETVSVPMEAMHTMPELGFQHRVGDTGFTDVLESLDDIYNSRNRTYRVRESKKIVVVSDIKGSKAGDVDPGRAWRKKRPSNVHEINRSMSTMSIGSQQARRTRELSGQLFVHLRDVNFDGLPLPRQPVKVTATLDNGRQRVDAAVRELGAKISLKKEFELVCSEGLAFSIHFSVPPAPPPPVVAPSPAPTPPASPTKPRGLRIFSSPKKRNATPVRAAPPPPPPKPDPFYEYISQDGQLATAQVVFSEVASQCRLKKARITVPFGAKTARSTRNCTGSLVVELLFVPALLNISKAQLPKSMDEVSEGLELAEWGTKITHESPLTQLGGDCTVWRRRQIKLRGSTLVLYSEVTKKSHVEINLALVASIADLNVPSMPTPGSATSRTDYPEDDDPLSRMEHSFRLVFKDGNRIDFYADNADVKRVWLEKLNEVVGKPENKKTPPEWALAARRLPPPKAT